MKKNQLRAYLRRKEVLNYFPKYFPCKVCNKRKPVGAVANGEFTCKACVLATADKISL